MMLSLKTKAIQGVFWTASSFLGVQLLNLLTTLMLASLLAPSDFGLVAVAHLVVTTAQVFRDLGLAQALIYRSDDAKEAANTAFFFGHHLGCTTVSSDRRYGFLDSLLLQ